MLSLNHLLNWKFTSELSFCLDNISYNDGHVNINMFKDLYRLNIGRWPQTAGILTRSASKRFRYSSAYNNMLSILDEGVGMITYKYPKG